MTRARAIDVELGRLAGDLALLGDKVPRIAPGAALIELRDELRAIEDRLVALRRRVHRAI